jgi:hypothetical protein
MIAFTREEAQQVLDALDFHSAGDEVDMKLISMLRYRLKQSTHASDCAVHNEPAYPAGECDCARLSAPEPEPVVWRTRRNDTWSYHHNKPHGIPHEPLYTTPPQPEPPCKTGSQCIGGKCPQCVVREWQGLTDEEIKSLLWETRVDNLTFARVIEKVLREKNAS